MVRLVEGGLPDGLRVVSSTIRVILEYMDPAVFDNDSVDNVLSDNADYVVVLLAPRAVPYIYYSKLFSFFHVYDYGER